MLVSHIASLVLRFHMVCYRFCPQALAEALKVNKTVTSIDLTSNEIGDEDEEAEAWCLARGFVAPGLRMGEENRVKVELSVVPVAFETCETLVVLNGCRICGSFQMSL